MCFSVKCYTPPRHLHSFPTRRSSDLKQGLAATLEYDTDLFDAATISRFLSHYEAILRQAVEDPEVKLKALVGRLARADEQRQAVKEDRLAEVSVRKLRGVKRRPITGP